MGRLTSGTMGGETLITGEHLIMAEVGTDETTGTETVIITHGEMVQGKEAHILREIIALARLQCRTDTQRMIRKRRKASKCRGPFYYHLLCSITDIILS
jgi:hypothetical protein